MPGLPRKQREPKMEDQFLQHYRQTDAKGPAWLQEIRKQGFQQFQSLGYPSAQQENWKYTSVRPLLDTAFQASEDYQPKHRNYDPLNCLNIGSKKNYRITFINGHFAQEFSRLEDLPQGVTILPLKMAFTSHDEKIRPYLGSIAPWQEETFSALNTAFLQDGAFVHLAPGAVLGKPLELLYLSLSDEAATASHPRTLIVAQAQAQGVVVENYSGKRSQHPYFTNALTEIITESGSQLSHYRIQEEDERAFHLGGLYVKQNRDSQFHSFNLNLGAQWARTEIRSHLGEPGAHCQLTGLYLGHGQQHLDNQTLIRHAVPQCTSQELYKGILDEKSHGIFNGQILVQPHAQKTQSSLSNKNLLLSRDAVVDTKPLLEIFANDVRCSHGATIGRLDETQVFYLRSRGIDEALARHLLTYAFASEVLQNMSEIELKQQLERSLLNRLKIAELSVEGEKFL